jgi:hypothetical protein
LANSILQKSLPKEPNKSDLKLNSEIRSDNIQRLFEPVNPRDAGYLPGIGTHFIGILETAVSNLSRLHEDLSKLEEELVKGGEL